jgi:hypothetical protein
MRIFCWPQKAAPIARTWHHRAAQHPPAQTHLLPHAHTAVHHHVAVAAHHKLIGGLIGKKILLGLGLVCVAVPAGLWLGGRHAAAPPSAQVVDVPGLGLARWRRGSAQ